MWLADHGGSGPIRGLPRGLMLMVMGFRGKEVILQLSGKEVRSCLVARCKVFEREFFYI